MKKFIFVFLCALIAGSISLYIDLLQNCHWVLFSRSGSIIVCFAVFVPFLPLPIRSSANDHFLAQTLRELAQEAGLQQFSNEASEAAIEPSKLRLRSTYYVLLSITGTLIWGYGDAAMKSVGLCT